MRSRLNPGRQGRFLATHAAPIVLVLMAVPALGATWTESLAKAQADAKKAGKPILANFTGSDWCPWCVKLGEEVFKTAEFKKWADENVILLYLDFPRTKAQPPALAKQNQALVQKYGIRGYPTVLFLSAEGAVIGRTGYKAGGAAAWIAAVQPILANAPKPEKVEPMASLGEAQTAAAGRKLPLLVLAGSARSPTGFKPILEDNAFAQFIKGRLLVAQVDTDAGAAETDNGKALAALREKLKAPKTATQILLADADGGKLLYSATAVLKGDVLMARLAAVLPKPAYDGSWLEDFAKAKQIAAALNRPILIDFTGSDWCTWCKKLDAEVFSQADFQKLAKDRLVLVKLDFPKQKKLPDDLAKQNQGLSQQFGVEGFPTVILADAAGGEKSRLTGFPQGGMSGFLQWLAGAVK